MALAVLVVVVLTQRFLNIGVPMRSTCVPRCRSFAGPAGISMFTVFAVLLSGCSATGSDSARVAGGADVGAVEATGPLPLRQVASVPRGLEFPPGVVDGSGVVRSPRVSLTRPAAADGSVEYRLFDVSAGGGTGPTGGQPVWQATSSDVSVQIEPRLTDSRVYSWQWRGRSGGDWRTGGSFTASFGGGGKSSTSSAGGVDVSLMTGESSWSWGSQQVGSPAGLVGVGLTWRSGAVGQPGLPSGWQLSVDTGSDWSGLSASEADRKVGGVATPGALGSGGSGPASVMVAGWSGSALTFVRNSSGVYELVTGLDAKVTRSVSASLVAADDAGAKWVLTEPGGAVTTFVDGRAVSVTSDGMPVSTLSWQSSGRLSGVTDALGRSVTLRYGGDGCGTDGWSASGWQSAPAGLLCQVDYPTGEKSEIAYTTVGSGEQIGLIKDPGNIGVTLGWDTNERISGLRSTLANRSASVDPAAATLASRVDYGDDARVSRILTAPTVPGGVAILNKFDLPEVTREKAARGAPVTATVSVATSSGGVGFKAVRTANGGAVKSVVMNASTWSPLSSTDRAGLTSSQSVDELGRVSSATDATGRVTAFKYNALGLPTELAGGVPAGSAGLVSTTRYDTASDGSAWNGLQAQMFADKNFSGDSKAGWWANDARGLAVSWDSAPVGSGPWSARAQGIYDPGLTDSAQYTFKVDSGGGKVVLFVDGNRCATNDTDGSCVFMLAKGPHQLQIDVSIDSPNGAGFFAVQAGPNGKPEPIPASQVRPAFSVVTKQTLNDVYPGSAADNGTTTDYAKPYLGQASSVTTPGGLSSAKTYEDNDWRASRWGRQLASTTAGGKTVTTAYWGNGEQASPPGVCPAGNEVSQSALTKSITRQDGSVVRYWYDSHARGIATQVKGQGGENQTSCASFDAAGLVTEAATYNNDEKLIEKTNFERAVNGKAWISRATITHGVGHPVSPGKSTTSTTVVNMAGQPVSYTDDSGTQTATSYTDLGDVQKVAITPPGAQRPALTMEYSYNTRTGLPETVTANGQSVATIAYTDDKQIQSVTYPQAKTKTIVGYAPNNSIRKIAIQAPGASYQQERELTEAGRTLRDRLVVKGPDPLTENRAYTYDDNARLTAAMISTDGVKKTFTYGYGREPNACPNDDAGVGRDALRTSGTREGTKYVTCYNENGQPRTTTDPLLTGGAGTAEISHDGLGRVTAITGRNPVKLDWTDYNQLARLSQETGAGKMVTTLDTYAGRLVNKTITAPEQASQNLTYSYPSAAAGQPAMLLDTGTNRVAGILYSLPGGALISQPATGAATLQIAGIDGSALATIPVPDTTATSKTPVTGTGAPQLEQRLGPYGESLSGTPPPPPTATNSATNSPTPEPTQPKKADPLPGDGKPDYGWQAGHNYETLPGPAAITLLGARPYQPALGQFLAPDSSITGGSNLYSYTSGDPINNSDPSGNDETLDWILSGVSMALTVVSVIAGGKASGALRTAAMVTTGVLTVAIAGVSIVQAVSDPSGANIAFAAFNAVLALGQGVNALRLGYGRTARERERVAFKPRKGEWINGYTDGKYPETEQGGGEPSQCQPVQPSQCQPVQPSQEQLARQMACQNPQLVLRLRRCPLRSND